VGFGKRLLDNPKGGCAREVQNGHGGCGHRNPAAGSSVTWIEPPTPVDADTGPGARLSTGHGYVYRKLLGWVGQQAPHMGGASVTDGRSVADSQDRRHLACVRWDQWAADQIHAAMESMQPAGLESGIDSRGSQPKRDELRARHNPVLSSGELHDGPFRARGRSSGTLTAYMTVNAPIVCGAP
jgi:hypothetical protein